MIEALLSFGYKQIENPHKHTICMFPPTRTFWVTESGVLVVCCDDNSQITISDNEITISPQNDMEPTFRFFRD